MPLAATLPLLSIALGLASAAMFLLVARTVWARPVSQESVRARNAFVTWWGVLGFVTGVGLVRQAPGFPASVTAFLAVSIISLAVLCVGLWGLLYYLLFLFTSRRGLALPLALGYVLYFAFLAAFILGGNPTSVASTKWGPEIVYSDPLDSGPVYWTAVMLLILPPFLAAGGYLSLYWKVTDPVQKRRILLVSLSILVWFGSALVGTGAGESDWWHIASRLIGLGAATTIYYAYRGLRPGEPQAFTHTPRPSEEPPLYGAPPRKGVSRVSRLAV
ncbi:MAG: hypothetical protein AABY18_03325 [Candidatus Thermoplasmatota archaeon]